MTVTRQDRPTLRQCWVGQLLRAIMGCARQPRGKGCSKKKFVEATMVGAVALAISGCFLTPYKHMEVPTKHVVMFNGRGKPVRTTGNLGPNRYSDFLSDRQMTTNHDCEG